MQVTVDQISDLEHCFTISVPEADLQPKIHKQLLSTAQKVKIKGFRQGKVPLKEVQRRYGEGIRFDVISQVIDESYRQAISEKMFRPAGAPSIQLNQSAPGQDLQFTAKFEVFPQIDLSQIPQVKIEVPESTIQPTDIDAVIEKMREERATWIDAGQAQAINGSQVQIDFVGKINGETFEGGTAENFDLILGSGSMIPGFEDQLLGAKAGQSLTLNLSFPEDYHNQEVAGKSVEFAVQVQAVRQRQLPELNADFFKTLGLQNATYEDFVVMVKKNMQRMLDEHVEQQAKTTLLDALLTVVNVKAPQALVEVELDRQRQRFKEQFASRSGGRTFPDELLKDLFANDAARQEATKQVQYGLLLSEVSEQQKLTPTLEQIQSKAAAAAAVYENPEAVAAYYLSDKKAYAQISGLAHEALIIDTLLKQVQVTRKPVGYLELVKMKS